MSKPNLSILLPTTVLDDIVPSFESIFGLRDIVTIFDSENVYHYGVSNANRECDLWSTIWVDSEEVGRVGLYIDSDNAMWAGAIQHLGLTLSYMATDSWRRNQLADEVLERYDELNLIYGLGTNFVQGMHQGEILQNVLEETNRILHADSGVMYVLDADKKIAPVSYFGDKANLDFWEGQVRELALSTLYAYEQAQLFDSDKIICAPLRYNEELLGALVLRYEVQDKNFNANDVNLVTTLMQNTALFIYAARLIDSLARRTVEIGRAHV